ncbi:MAG: hypothetical protein NC828_01240 [Candidatus Omnitrophica bacterium]|nr:hypothetical protein [Candidatus Omnitrophota bacterium]
MKQSGTNSRTMKGFALRWAIVKLLGEGAPLDRKKLNIKRAKKVPTGIAITLNRLESFLL